jgi:hypothetical protein
MLETHFYEVNGAQNQPAGYEKKEEKKKREKEA